MPSTWSKPYASILVENASLWTEAKTKSMRQAAVKTVADKIINQIDKDGDKRIEKLEDVSCNCTFSQFISITFFRKFAIGTTTASLGQVSRRTLWPRNDTRRKLSRRGM